MDIAISGASGLIGSRLVSQFKAGGHSIIKLVRTKPGSGAEVLWDPYGSVDKKALDGVQAVVHLAGENIGQRWNADAKTRIMESRRRGTRTLCEALASLTTRPDVLVCASAIGYYGDRGSELLTEDSGPGTGFLADVCVEWEKATEPAAAAGIRVVNLRLGIVLDPKGGALGKMLTPFRLGAGGNMGSGTQYWSWIAMDDVIGAFQHAVSNDALRGGVNGTSPNPVTNAEFTQALASVLQRPALFPMPSFAARLALGEMAEALLLSSAQIQPAHLIASGYQFRFPELEGALRHLL